MKYLCFDAKYVDLFSSRIIYVLKKCVFDFVSETQNGVFGTIFASVLIPNLDWLINNEVIFNTDTLVLDKRLINDSHRLTQQFCQF